MSHWPCVTLTDNSVYPPTGLTTYEREMSTPPTLLRSMALLYLYVSFAVTVGSSGGSSKPICEASAVVCYSFNCRRLKAL